MSASGSHDPPPVRKTFGQLSSAPSQRRFARPPPKAPDEQRKPKRSMSAPLLSVGATALIGFGGLALYGRNSPGAVAAPNSATAAVVSAAAAGAAVSAAAPRGDVKNANNDGSTGGGRVAIFGGFGGSGASHAGAAS